MAGEPGRQAEGDPGRNDQPLPGVHGERPGGMNEKGDEEDGIDDDQQDEAEDEADDKGTAIGGGRATLGDDTGTGEDAPPRSK